MNSLDSYNFTADQLSCSLYILVPSRRKLEMELKEIHLNGFPIYQM